MMRIREGIRCSIPFHSLPFLSYGPLIQFNNYRDVLTVKCGDTEAFRLCRYYDKEKCTFTFPWMDENRWYPLSVWFFLVRNTLVIDSLPPWNTPEIARLKFPIDRIKSTDTAMVCTVRVLYLLCKYAVQMNIQMSFKSLISHPHVSLQLCYHVLYSLAGV